MQPNMATKTYFIASKCLRVLYMCRITSLSAFELCVKSKYVLLIPIMLSLHTGADAEHICLCLCSSDACLPASLSTFVRHLLPDNRFVKPSSEESCRSRLKMTLIREVRGTKRKANSVFSPV